MSQFTVTLHCQTQKLMYFQSSIKDGPVKVTIDGLSQSGDNYQQVIDTLKARNDHLCLIH